MSKELEAGPIIAAVSQEIPPDVAPPPEEVATTPDISQIQNNTESLPQSDIEQVVRRGLNKHTTRRSFGKWLFRGVVATYFGAPVVENIYKEQRYVDTHWEKTKPTVDFLTEYDPDIHHEVMFFFPGTGDVHSREEAEDLQYRSPLADKVPVAYLTMSHEKTTKQDVVDLIRKEFGDRPPKYVSFVGRSFGGIFALEVFAELGIEVRRFALLDSPDSLADAHDGSAAEFVSKHAPHWGWLDLEIVEATNYDGQMKEHGDLHAISNFERTKKAVGRGEDPVSIRGEVDDMREARLASHRMFLKFSKIFNPKVTKAKFVASHDPRTDHTVEDVNSYHHYKHILNKLHVPLDWDPADFDGHADMSKSVVALHPWLEATNPPFDFEDQSTI